MQADDNYGFDILDVKIIKEHTRTRWIAKEILLFEEIESTNVKATVLAGSGASHGTLVLANSQTDGKGRRGRSWHTPRGTSIAMSVILKPQLEAEYASMLTLIQALAVVKALEEKYGLQSQIKWPNDILIHERKICGILTEMNLKGTQIASIIIGTGINVNQEKFPQEIAQIATSLKRENGQVICREVLIAAICEKFEYYFELFMKNKELSFMLEEYNACLVSAGRKVKVLDPKGEFTGEALGINKHGELLVRTAEGEVVNVYAGEVSVRGVYGYV